MASGNGSQAYSRSSFEVSQAVNRKISCLCYLMTALPAFSLPSKGYLVFYLLSNLLAALCPTTRPFVLQRQLLVFSACFMHSPLQWVSVCMDGITGVHHFLTVRFLTLSAHFNYTQDSVIQHTLYFFNLSLLV